MREWEDVFHRQRSRKMLRRATVRKIDRKEDEIKDWGGGGR